MFHMKEKEDYVCLYNIQDVLTSLTVIIDLKYECKIGMNFIRTTFYDRFDYVKNESIFTYDFIINYNKNSSFCYYLNS